MNHLYTNMGEKNVFFNTLSNIYVSETKTISIYTDPHIHMLKCSKKAVKIFISI